MPFLEVCAKQRTCSVLRKSAFFQVSCIYSQNVAVKLNTFQKFEFKNEKTNFTCFANLVFLHQSDRFQQDDIAQIVHNYLARLSSTTKSLDLSEFSNKVQKRVISISKLYRNHLYFKATISRKISLQHRFHAPFKTGFNR